MKNTRTLTFLLVASHAALGVAFFAYGQPLQSATRQAPPKSSSGGQTLPKGLLESLRSNVEDLEQTEWENASLRFAMHDLNRDGVQEYFVTGLCAPVGNCAFWVLREEATGYRVLLRGSAQAVCVRSTRTNGFHDVEVRSHGSALDTGVVLFQFDGQKYDTTEAYNLRWEVDEKTGKERQLAGQKKKPKCRKLTFRAASPLGPTGKN